MFEVHMMVLMGAPRAGGFDRGARGPQVLFRSPAEPPSLKLLVL